MKGIAIVRSSITENHEEQRLKIAAYAQSEGINVIHLDIRVDDNFENIYDSLDEADVVIVTDITRISREKRVLGDFLSLLEQKYVRLISLSEIN
ncbi:recombinase family protein [Schinkia sp. CFF1]